MGWLRRMRALFAPRRGGEASAALDAANRSHDRAVGEREAMTRLRREADRAGAEVRAHNEANRFDDFLARVIRGEQ
jgi:hypothetical protein